jgi:uncharacterized protein (TIGR02145 family)
MEKKNRIWINPLILMGLVLILISSCKKDNNNPTQSGGIIYNSSLTYGTVTDVDGNVYKTITIGTQTWMAENLKVTHYRNGDTISKINNSTQWYQVATGAYCDYNNNTSKAATYGKLYNWLSIIDTRNVCPTGWHVPSDVEWTILFNYLGGDTVAAFKMMEKGTTHWAYLNPGATNLSGFTALPGGMRYFDGGFIDLGLSGYWWSSTPAGDYYNLDADYIYLGVDYNVASYGSGSKNNGISIRCVKD